MSATTGAERWTVLATRVLAPNPGPMTLDGTNSFVVRRQDSPGVVIVDPGPDLSDHLQLLTLFGRVELILLTHRHVDHSEAARRFAKMTGAPVRAVDPALCVDAPALEGGEELTAGGTAIRVVATPGHTADSACFHLPDDRVLGGLTASGSMLTGDTVLGRGTTVIDRGDGSLKDYMGSLNRLLDFRGTTVLPGHGPMLDDLAVIAAAYIAHRGERLRQVSAAVDELGGLESALVTASSIADVVYADVPTDLRGAAEASLAAQLDYLRELSQGTADSA